MTTPHRTLREAAQMALDALLTGYHQGTQDAIAALREALAAPEPELVALESIHLTRDTRGMCVVRVNGRVAIRDNGDIIDHMATLEWFATPPAAPAPAMLQALEEMLEVHGVRWEHVRGDSSIPASWVELSDKARAAIKAAKGEA